MLSWDRVRQLPCGCRYDAPTGMKTHECEACLRERHRRERLRQAAKSKQARRSGNNN